MTNLQKANIDSYQKLMVHLVGLYPDKSKSEIGNMIGISAKQFYRLLAGDEAGVYTQRKLALFLKENLNYRIEKDGQGIKLIPIENSFKKTNSDKQQSVENYAEETHSEHMITYLIEKIGQLDAQVGAMKFEIAELKNKTKNL